MNEFLKATAGVLLAVILVLSLGKEGKQTAVLLVLAVCGMVGILAMSYFEPVLAFVRRLGSIGNINHDILSILLKVVGIGLIGEIAALICVDSGNASLGKILQILCGAVVLRLALPLMEQLLDLLERILGKV